MVMERYEQHLPNLGDYQIRQILTVDMKKARTAAPYIVGNTMGEEIEHGFHVPLTHTVLLLLDSCQNKSTMII
jgi:hypothetical protein